MSENEEKHLLQRHSNTLSKEDGKKIETTSFTYGNTMKHVDKSNSIKGTHLFVYRFDTIYKCAHMCIILCSV